MPIIFQGDFMAVEFGIATITKTGQITIPKNIRKAEKLGEGTKLRLVDVDGKIIMQRIDLERVSKAIEALTRLNLDE